MATLMTESNRQSEGYKSYIGTSASEQQAMLEAIGKKDVLELFSDVPSEYILNDYIDIPGPYSETQLDKLFRKIAKKNNSDVIPFLGGGVRPTYIPAFLEEVMRRGEIYTAYTSYQPEIAQGMLQMLFEYESLVAELSGMDVVNASLYDWASALGEVAKMMARLTRKSKILLLGPIGPNRVATMESYIKHVGVTYEHLFPNEHIDVAKVIEIIEAEASKDRKEKTIAGIYFEVPNYYGALPSDLEKITAAAQKQKIFTTAGVDFISLGIIKPPADYGVDFIIGEGQLLGNPISSGGPLLGILASKYDRKLISQFPGRLIGITKDERDGDDAYCITLSTREQHIRREKATSNICSNQALAAVNAGIYLASLGARGIEELAQGLMDRANYLAGALTAIDGVRAPLYGPIFAEFVAEFDGITHEQLEASCDKFNVIPGKPLDRDGCYRLIAVNDMMSREDLDQFVAAVKEVYKQ